MREKRRKINYQSHHTGYINNKITRMTLILNYMYKVMEGIDKSQVKLRQMVQGKIQTFKHELMLLQNRATTLSTQKQESLKNKVYVDKK